MMNTPNPGLSQLGSPYEADLQRARHRAAESTAGLRWPGAKLAAQWGNPPPGRVQTLADLGIGQDVPLIPETLGALQERSFALIDEARASFDALEKRLGAVLRVHPAPLAERAPEEAVNPTPAVIKTQQELNTRLAWLRDALVALEGRVAL